MSRRFFLEGWKFGVYLIVPIGLAIGVTVPSIREKVLSQFSLSYPVDRPGEDLEKLKHLKEKRQ